MANNPSKAQSKNDAVKNTTPASKSATTTNITGASKSPMSTDGQRTQSSSGQTVTEKSDRRTSTGSTTRRSSSTLQDAVGATNAAPLVPGNAMEKMIRKSQEMANLRNQLKALVAMQIAPDEFSERSDVYSSSEIEALKKPTVSSIDQKTKTPPLGDLSVGEAPALEKSKLRRSPNNPCVYVSEDKTELKWNEYEADTNVKVTGYPCESEGVADYNAEREKDRMQRKPDPFFIPPERFIPGVYCRLSCIPAGDEKVAMDERRGKPSKCKASPVPYEKSSISILQSRAVKMLLDEYTKKRTDNVSSARKSAVRKPRAPLQAAKARATAAGKDESHISLDPNAIVFKEPFTDRKMELFKVRNDGKQAVALKLDTSNNIKLQVTLSWTFLNPGETKVFTVFFSPRDVPNGYSSETVYVNYCNSKESQAQEKWKRAELNVEFKHEAKIDVETKEQLRTPRPSLKEFATAVNPFPYDVTDALPVIERPFDEQVKAIELELQKAKAQQSGVKLEAERLTVGPDVKVQKARKAESPTKSKASADHPMTKMAPKPPLKPTKEGGSPTLPAPRTPSTLTSAARQLSIKRRRRSLLKEAPLTPKQKKGKSTKETAIANSLQKDKHTKQTTAKRKSEIPNKKNPA